MDREYDEDIVTKEDEDENIYVEVIDGLYYRINPVVIES